MMQPSTALSVVSLAMQRNGMVSKNSCTPATSSRSTFLYSPRTRATVSSTAFSPPRRASRMLKSDENCAKTTVSRHTPDVPTAKT